MPLTDREREALALTLAGEIDWRQSPPDSPQTATEAASILETAVTRLEGGRGRYEDLADVVLDRAQYSTWNDDRGRGIARGNYAQFGPTIDNFIDGYFSGAIEPVARGITSYWNPSVTGVQSYNGIQTVSDVGPHRFAVDPSRVPDAPANAYAPPDTVGPGFEAISDMISEVPGFNASILSPGAVEAPPDPAGTFDLRSVTAPNSPEVDLTGRGLGFEYAAAPEFDYDPTLPGDFGLAGGWLEGMQELQAGAEPPVTRSFTPAAPTAVQTQPVTASLDPGAPDYRSFGAPEAQPADAISGARVDRAFDAVTPAVNAPDFDFSTFDFEPVNYGPLSHGGGFHGSSNIQSDDIFAGDYFSTFDNYGPLVYGPASYSRSVEQPAPREEPVQVARARTRSYTPAPAPGPSRSSAGFSMANATDVTGGVPLDALSFDFEEPLAPPAMAEKRAPAPTIVAPKEYRRAVPPPPPPPPVSPVAKALESIQFKGPADMAASAAQSAPAGADFGDTFWSEYTRTGGQDDEKSMAAAMSTEQQARRNAGELTFGDAFGGGNATGASRVLCTYFMREGDLDRALWKAEMQWTTKHSSLAMRRGYHWWAVPAVLAMRADTRLGRALKPLLRWMTLHRAYEIGRISGIREQGSLQGRAIRWVMEPLCSLIGRVLDRDTDWSAVYR